MDPRGKGMVVNDKEKESFVNEPKDDKPTDSGSGHRRKEGKKKKTIGEKAVDVLLASAKATIANQR